jgi:hypothetical protein
MRESLGGVIDDRRLNEIALALYDLRLPDCELIAVLLAIFQKGLDSLVPGVVGRLKCERYRNDLLHEVLHGAKHDILRFRAHLQGLRILDHFGHEAVVYLFMNVNTLGGNAHLARILECAHCNVRCNYVNVDVFADNGGVVATALSTHRQAHETRRKWFL